MPELRQFHGLLVEEMALSPEFLRLDRIIRIAPHGYTGACVAPSIGKAVGASPSTAIAFSFFKARSDYMYCSTYHSSERANLLELAACFSKWNGYLDRLYIFREWFVDAKRRVYF